MEVSRSRVVAEAGPCLHHARWSRPRDAVEGRKLPEKTVVPLEHARDLSLLEHQLRYENAIRIARVPPGKVAAVGAKPAAKPPSELAALVIRDARGAGRARRCHRGAKDMSGAGLTPARNAVHRIRLQAPAHPPA